MDRSRQERSGHASNHQQEHHGQRKPSKSSYNDSIIWYVGYLVVLNVLCYQDTDMMLFDPDHPFIWVLPTLSTLFTISWIGMTVQAGSKKFQPTFRRISHFLGFCVIQLLVWNLFPSIFLWELTNLANLLPVILCYFFHQQIFNWFSDGWVTICEAFQKFVNKHKPQQGVGAVVVKRLDKIYKGIKKYYGNHTSEQGAIVPAANGAINNSSNEEPDIVDTPETYHKALSFLMAVLLLLVGQKYKALGRNVYEVYGIIMFLLLKVLTLYAIAWGVTKAHAPETKYHKVLIVFCGILWVVAFELVLWIFDTPFLWLGSNLCMICYLVVCPLLPKIFEMLLFIDEWLQQNFVGIFKLLDIGDKASSSSSIQVHSGNATENMINQQSIITMDEAQLVGDQVDIGDNACSSSSVQDHIGNATEKMNNQHTVISDILLEEEEEEEKEKEEEMFDIEAQSGNATKPINDRDSMDTLEEQV